MEKRLTKIELFKEQMNFSVGHFTIFSAEKRENLHGHNFSVHITLEAEVKENGLAFDYGIYKKVVLELCRSLDEVVLLPSKNSYLKIEESTEYIYAYFGQEKIPFLKRDVKLLPLENITVEELSYWFVKELLTYIQTSQEHIINMIEVKIFSSPGQSGASSWIKKP
jgi:6-pyruvoyltetrahydropterin/6-carboxytetrahydropterin synthase